MFKEALEQKKAASRLDVTADDLVRIHHRLMSHYGWIPLEDLKQIPAVTILNLLAKMNEEDETPVPVAIAGRVKM